MRPGEPSDQAGIYVHVPFCSAVCPYCDFAVTTGDEARRTVFVDRLLREVALAPFSFPIDTVYFGGGTPSCLPDLELERAVRGIESAYPVTSDAWWTIEANPEDVTPERVRRWRELGFRTVSLGVQSFDEDELRFLGRRHDPDRARSAVLAARDAQFETVSVDLIFGLPDQGPSSFQRSLDRALATGPDHLSVYQLTVSSGTPFGRWRDQGRLVELDEEAQSDLFLGVVGAIAERGFEPYEVSNFAREPKHRSIHNQKYWSHVPYLGLGPSAHSFDGTTRWWNLRGDRDWGKAVEAGRRPVAEREELAPRDLALETVMLRLRTAAGLDRASFRSRFGFDLVEANSDYVRASSRRGLIDVTSEAVRPRTNGLAVADALAAGFDVSAAR